MALAAHIREGNEKGINLCLWAGADPHAKVPNLYLSDDRGCWSAIEAAVRSGDLQLLKRLTPDPSKDDFDDLYQGASNGSVVEFLASICLPKDLTSILKWQFWFHELKLRGSALWTIEALLTHAGPWRESDPAKISDIRRSLLKLDEYHFRQLVRALGKTNCCAPESYAELIRTPSMQKRLLALNIIKPRISERERRREERTRLAYRYDREKLYDEVWSKPAMHVAASYGFSGVFLGKICRKLLIPVPPRGYWARVRSGYKARRPPLPKLNLPRTRQTGTAID